MNMKKYLNSYFLFFVIFLLKSTTTTFAQNHGDIELPPDGDPNCAASLNAPLSSQDWFDCPTPGDIMHCQRFVEIGRNLFPTNKLEVSHDDNDRRREGISINNTREDLVRTNEIYFRKNDAEHWAIGNDFTTDGNHNFFIWDHLNEITRMFFTGDSPDLAYIGVNNNLTPIATLDVNGNFRASTLASPPANSVVQANSQGILQNVAITNFASVLASGVNYWTKTNNELSYAAGNVFIGFTPPCVSGCANPLYKLYVEGGIMARDIKVTATTPFPDFVFDKKYHLRSIPELEKYILQNKHLPNFESTTEVEKNEGFELGAMQRKLLQTIEEQALYIIDLQKQMEALKMEFSTIKNR